MLISIDYSIILFIKSEVKKLVLNFKKLTAKNMSFKSHFFEYLKIQMVLQVFLFRTKFPLEQN